VYDEIGRLVAAIDANGEAATYTYDEVGNVLSIARLSSGTAVKIVYVSPGEGAIGATVIVSGTGFSATPAQNTLTFNGTSATVTAATTTQLVTTVPSGATTGTISVTTPSGSAVSPESFVVVAGAGGAPTITGFSPTVGVPGVSLSVTGTNFDPQPANDHLRVNVTYAAVSSATPTALTTVVPVSGSGRLRITTPVGSAESSADLYIPPTPYTASDVVHTSRTTAGTSATMSITSSGKIGMVIFDATAHTRVSAVVTSSSVGSCSSGSMGLFRPEGPLFTHGDLCANNSIIGPLTVPQTGTYALVADPSGSTTGNVTVTPYTFVDASATLTFGQSVSPSLSTPGQRGVWTFGGTANQRVSAVVNTTTVGQCGFGVFTILKPDGTTLATDDSLCSGTIVGPSVLPTTGTYTVVADPYQVYTGSITVTAYNVIDATGSLTLGQSTAASLSTPGQRGVWTFSGTANQRVSAVVNSSTVGQCGFGDFTILKPDGTTLVTDDSLCSGVIVGPSVLPTTGTYTVVADPYNAYTGNLTVTVYDVVDVTGSLTFGQSANAALSTPGQRAVWTFAGTANERVSTVINTSSVGSCGFGTLTVLKPDGTTLGSASSVCAGASVAATVLPTTGTYTVIVDPYSSYTGSVTLTVKLIPDAPAGTIWANSATASTQYSSGNWSAAQAAGAPNVWVCDSIAQAWAPSTSGSGGQWLEATFTTPVTAVGVWIHETYTPGFITRVDFKDTNDTYTTVWTGTDTTPCVNWFSLSFSPTALPVKAVKIYTQIAGWEEIDAVGLVPAP
jgi:YD repeat-containing protein